MHLNLKNYPTKDFFDSINRKFSLNYAADFEMFFKLNLKY